MMKWCSCSSGVEEVQDAHLHRGPVGRQQHSDEKRPDHVPLSSPYRRYGGSCRNGEFCTNVYKHKSMGTLNLSGHLIRETSLWPLAQLVAPVNTTSIVHGQGAKCRRMAALTTALMKPADWCWSHHEVQSVLRHQYTLNSRLLSSFYFAFSKVGIGGNSAWQYLQLNKINPFNMQHPHRVTKACAGEKPGKEVN